jgi:hypothetical protein
MCHQESALYGDLVLYLRDCAAELLAGDDPDIESQQERLDTLIRDWFFTPQDRLHGCAPRDLIWAEQKGEANPIDPERLVEFFDDDDCPVCQLTRQEIQRALETGEDHGFNWFYDDGGYPLIAHYDPEGWDERWAEDMAEFEAVHTTREEPAEGESRPTEPPYEPPPLAASNLSPAEFLAHARQPWLDPALHEVASMLAERVDCPTHTLTGLRYRRLTYDEALTLSVGLHNQGVDLPALMDQIEAFPYQNVALDWLAQPEENAFMMVRAMEEMLAPDDEAEMTRFRHHRDFIFTLARLVHPGARLWLQGWLDAVIAGAFTRTGADDTDIPF